MREMEEKRRRRRASGPTAKRASGNSQLLHAREHHADERARHEELPQRPAIQALPRRGEQVRPVGSAQARAHCAQDNLSVRPSVMGRHGGKEGREGARECGSAGGREGREEERELGSFMTVHAIIV